MALGNEEIIQNGKVFFAKICVKQIFLSFYGERFALTIFLNRPTFCIETNGNVGCNSSEKYPSTGSFLCMVQKLLLNAPNI